MIHVTGWPARPPVTPCAVWGPGVAFWKGGNGRFDVAAGGALDRDVTLDSLRQVRFFLPSFWKNKSMFRLPRGAAAGAERLGGGLQG